MPQHGEFDLKSNRIFCDYWMTQKEFEDIHDYAIDNDEYKENIDDN